jgi:carboxyl-terminal processing protease
MMQLSFRRMAGFLFIGLLVGISFIAGLFLSPQLLGRPIARSNEQQQHPLLDEAWTLAQSQFFGTAPSDKARTYGAIHGMIGIYHDPYTIFAEPPATELQDQQLTGKFGGIGANIRREADGRLVLSPFPDQAAARAGVQEGDALIKVDDEAVTAATPLEDILAWLRGEVGTSVQIQIQRGSQQLSFTILRAEINTPSVIWRIIEQAPDIGYVSLSVFSQTSSGELVKAINDLRGRGVRRLILDLRDNGGGLLDAAIDVAGQFVTGTVAIEIHRDKSEANFAPKSIGVALDLPLVVLVNHGTASAAEIVAGAVQDKRRGALIGDQTYGKGSVQNILPLSDGSSLHVTVAEWLTPNRRQISGQGLTPDIVIARTLEDTQAGRDTQLDRAIMEVGK